MSHGRPEHERLELSKPEAYDPLRLPLDPVIKVARMTKNYFYGVFSYFHHHVTNAMTEGLDSKIATIQTISYGFGDKKHFRIATHLHCL